MYGQSKAAGDAVAATVPRHYIIRTSWVVGDGKNFVKTMSALAERDIDPNVVDDQFGRLSFTEDIAAGIGHLFASKAPFGTYNLTNEGAIMSWADVARHVFEMRGADSERVTGVSSATYFAGKSVAPRPMNSVLALDKIEATGFTPRPALDALRAYTSTISEPR